MLEFVGIFLTIRMCCHILRMTHRNNHSAETVVGSSLTHHVALFVPLSGSIDPVVDRRGFTGSAKDRL